VIVVLYLTQVWYKKAQWLTLLFQFGQAGFLGVGLFLLLRGSPVFPSLFTRGSDFTFSLTEVLYGQVDQIRGNAEKISRWLIYYASLGIILIGITLLVFLTEYRRHRTHTSLPPMLWLPILLLVFLSPLIVTGKVLASRYLLPTVIFLIPLMVMSFEYWWKRGYTTIMILATMILGIQLLYFDSLLLFKPESTPFAREDVEQYLTEWSAGFGNAEVRDWIRAEAMDKKLVVATEGYFGTLPDGLLMYFDNSEEISRGNLEIFGVGQPIRELPDIVKEKTGQHEVYLLVNEHRLLFDTQHCCELVSFYPRPKGGPALLLFRVFDDEEYY